jgi:ornithine cyclodeaminase
MADKYMQKDENGLLCRIAWGTSIGIKMVTIFPDNVSRVPSLPSILGLFILCSGATGQPLAMVDGSAITTWKTAADSALGSDLLSRRSAATLTMVGAGAMAEALIRAHLTVRPGVSRVMLWNRTRSRAEALRARLSDLAAEVTIAEDLEAAVRAADIISCATMAREPLIRGRWLKPGAHLDLVGAYKADMREADDEAITRGRLFLDSRETVLQDIGELLIPLREGIIGPDDVLGDLFDMIDAPTSRRGEDEVTIFKNGGGAHLDLMIADAVYRASASVAA